MEFPTLRTGSLRFTGSATAPSSRATCAVLYGRTLKVVEILCRYNPSSVTYITTGAYSQCSRLNRPTLFYLFNHVLKYTLGVNLQCKSWVMRMLIIEHSSNFAHDTIMYKDTHTYTFKKSHPDETDLTQKQFDTRRYLSRLSV